MPTITLSSVLQSGIASGVSGFTGISGYSGIAAIQVTNIFIPAAEMIPRSTNPCGINSVELSGNLINYDVTLFDPGTNEFAQFIRVMPNNWNLGNITAIFQWTASATGNVVWGMQARSYADGNALNQAFGTAQTVTSVSNGSGNITISGATANIAIGGTVGNNLPIIFQIYREANNVADTLAVDAELMMVNITYSVG